MIREKQLSCEGDQVRGEKLIDIIKSLYKPHELILETKQQLFTELLERSRGKAVVVDPDIFKHLFSDYSESGHKTHSKLSREYLDFILESDKSRESVLFTAGGSGSGKTEVVIKSALNEGFSDIVVDGTLANFSDAVRNIDCVLMAGKTALVRGVLPNVSLAYRFVLDRFVKTGRPVPMHVFLNKHIGFVQTFPELIEKYKGNQQINFSLIDCSEINTFVTYTEKEDIKKFITNLHRNLLDRKKLEAELLLIEKDLGIQNPTE